MLHIPTEFESFFSYAVDSSKETLAHYSPFLAVPVLSPVQASSGSLIIEFPQHLLESHIVFTLIDKRIR